MELTLLNFLVTGILYQYSSLLDAVLNKINSDGYNIEVTHPKI